MTSPLKLGIDPAHGTRSRYVLGCRCDDCRRARADAARVREARAREAVTHIPLNPGGQCPGIEGDPCPNGTRLRANSLGVCWHCANRASWDGLVDAAPVRAHMRKLSAQGVGYKSAAAAADVGKTTLFEVMTGEKTRMRKQAADRVLAVTADAVADYALVPAGETNRLLRELADEYLTKGRLALELGYAQPALQIGTRKRVRAKTAHRVRKLHRRIAE